MCACVSVRVKLCKCIKTRPLLNVILCSGGNRFLYAFEVLLLRLLIAGFLQPLCAVFTAVVVLPVASLLIFIGKL